MRNDSPTDEWLAERNAAGYAISSEHDTPRIERQLLDDESPLVVPLRLVTELMRTPVVAANDNVPPADDGVDSSSGTGVERIHNQGSIVPSVPMLLAAYEAGIENGGFSFVEGSVLLGSTNWRRKLTGLIFRDGELIAYGDYKGKKRRPSYNPKVADAEVDEKSETAKHVAAVAEQNIAYTRLRAAGAYVSAQRPDASRSLAPPPRTARAAANDNVLATAIANTKIMPAVTTLPDGVAHKYGRLAGIADVTGRGEGGTSAPMHDVLSELERADKLQAAGIYREDLDIIEDILADASFRTIGIQRGYAESSASAMGRKVVEDALKRISEKIAA